MKVVLFCGGLGMRLREYSENIPKPMVPIGYRPILWNVMKYYAYYGHKDFILCLGYKADMIKNYFVNYDEFVSNDFVFREGGKNLQLINSDIHDWTITFVDTGLHANIGQRLLAVREYLDGEDVFLANYSDGLSNVLLPDMIEHFQSGDHHASFLCVKPTQSFHMVKMGSGKPVEKIQHIADSGIRINGGFFILRNEIFNYIDDGDELVLEPFQRLIEHNKITGYKYDGFWVSMDTLKDKQLLDDMYARGETHWEVWKNSTLRGKRIER